MGIRVPWQWLAASSLPPLTRCCAAEIKSALLALLAGEAFLARRSWQEIWWGRMHLDLARGWQVQIAIERDQLGALMWAQAPDGRDWVYGCQRDDWTLGPDSQIVEPVGLLDLEQRQQLERVLRNACCWPPPEIRCELVFPNSIWEPARSKRRMRPQPPDSGRARLRSSSKRSGS
jgi:hypothetical protein